MAKVARRQGRRHRRRTARRHRRRITSSVLRQSLFSAAREVADVDHELDPEEESLLGQLAAASPEASASRRSAPTGRRGRRRCGRDRRGRRDLDVDVARRRPAGARRPPPWPAPISSTSQPPGREPRRRAATIGRMASSPSAAGEQRACGSQSRPTSSTAASSVGDVRRVGDDDVERAAQLGGQRVEPVPSAMRTSAARPPDAGEVGAGDVEARRRDTSVAHTSTRRPAARRPATGRSRPTAGAEVDDARPAPAATGPASMATPATTSVSGRGISTRRSTIRSRRRNAQRPSTYCSGSPADRRATIASRWATARSVAGSSSTRVDSRRRRRSPPRTASGPAGRSPTAAGRSRPSSSRQRDRRRQARQPSSLGELAGPLVGDQGVDDLVEVAGQHLLRAGRA